MSLRESGNLCVSALRAWCAWLTDQGYLVTDPAARVKLVSGQERSKREGLSNTQVNALNSLWLSQKGGRLSTSAIGQMIAELVKDAGDLVPQDASAHTLRHTFARSYLAQYPGDVVGLAALLGHSSLDTTRLYSEPSLTKLAMRVEHLNINAFFGRAPGRKTTCHAPERTVLRGVRH